MHKAIIQYDFKRLNISHNEIWCCCMLFEAWKLLSYGRKSNTGLDWHEGKKVTDFFLVNYPFYLSLNSFILLCRRQENMTDFIHWVNSEECHFKKKLLCSLKITFNNKATARMLKPMVVFYMKHAKALLTDKGLFLWTITVNQACHYPRRQFLRRWIK